MKFQIGDRVVLTALIQGWQDKGFGPEAVITHVMATGGIGAGSKSSSDTCYGIHLDHYDYGPNADNHHTVSDAVIELVRRVEPSADEIEAALKSILSVGELND